MLQGSPVSPQEGTLWQPCRRIFAFLYAAQPHLAHWFGSVEEMWVILTAVIVTVGALLPATVGAGDTVPASLLAGSWIAAETVEEKEQRLRAIDAATNQLGRLQRGRARSRLQERTAPPPRLTIALTDSTVALTSGDLRLAVALGGAPAEVPTNQGKAWISAQVGDQRLTVVARGDDGDRTTIYHASHDDLTVEVTLMSPNLAGVLKYRSSYVRVKSTAVTSPAFVGIHHGITGPESPPR